MTYSAKLPQYQLYPVDQFRGDGVRTVFTLTQNVIGNNSILVWVDGLKLATTVYNVNGDLLTLFIAPQSPSTPAPNIEVFYLNVQDQGRFGVGGVTEINVLTFIPGLTFTGGPITSSGAITLALTGSSFPVNAGGTGQTTFGQNQLLLGNGTNALNTVSGTGTVGQLLTSQGTSAPTFTNAVNSVSGGNTGLRFSTIAPPAQDIATGAATLTGLLAVNNGGTGANSLGVNQILLGSGTSAITSLVSGADGFSLVSGGPGNPPTWRQLPSADPTFGVGSLFVGLLPATANVNPGGTFTATNLLPITIFATGTGSSMTLSSGTYTMLGSVNQTEEAFLWRTA